LPLLGGPEIEMPRRAALSHPDERVTPAELHLRGGKEIEMSRRAAQRFRTVMSG
jgi:hypothetical protein